MADNINNPILEFAVNHTIEPEKFNKSPNQKKIKKQLDLYGHTNVQVWWEQIGKAQEMCGNEGGYFFNSDQEDLYCLGYSFQEAMDLIQNSNELMIVW